MLRETKRFKSRGFVVSFGDIMLPLVGIVAIGLLLVAGKLFFLSGISAKEKPPVSSLAQEQTVQKVAELKTEHTLGLPAVSLSGDMSLKEKSGAVAKSSGKSSSELDVLAIPVNNQVKAETDIADKSVAVKKEEVKPKSSDSKNASDKKASDSKNASGKKASDKDQKTVSKTAVTDKQPSDKQLVGVWRIQVAAFNTKATAEGAAQRLVKLGFKTTIASGLKFHRLIVIPSSSKQTKEEAIEGLKKEGYKDAFLLSTEK